MAGLRTGPAFLLNMKKTIALTLIALAGALHADTPHVQVKTAAFSITLPPTNQQVVLEPLRTVTPIGKRQGFTDTTGQITFSNSPAGQYSLRIRGVQDLEIDIPDTSGVIQAIDYVTTPGWVAPAAAVGDAIFRSVPYLWPASQGDADTVLKNDGSGNLSWGQGQGTDLESVTNVVNALNLWTNAGDGIIPADLTQPVAIGEVGAFGRMLYVQAASSGTAIQGNPFAGSGGLQALYWSGSHYGVLGRTRQTAGQGVAVFGASDAAETNTVSYSIAGFMDAGGRANQTNVAVAGSSDANSEVAVGGYFEVANGYSTSTDPNFVSAVLLLDRRDNVVPLIVARANNGSPLFTVDSGGAVTSADYISAGTYVNIVGTTNQVIFGATNTPPSSDVAPTKWISVQVTGDPGVYRLPLYE